MAGSVSRLSTSIELCLREWSVTGFWAGEDLSPNDIELARRRAMALPGFIVLASSNPPPQGLLFPEGLFREAADGYWSNRRYEPDPHGLPATRAAIVDYYAG